MVLEDLTERKQSPSSTVFITLKFNSLSNLGRINIIWAKRVCAVPHLLLILYGIIIHIYFPQCNSFCRFVTTLQWRCHNSWEWLPNGPLKLLSPVCLMAGARHKVDLRLELALSLPGDSEDSSQEPSCPYQVARKYLKSSVPGPISSKGLLRDFWKNTTLFEWLMLMRGQQGRRRRRREMGRCCCFSLQPRNLPCYNMLALIITPWHRECCGESATSSNLRAEVHFRNSDKHWMLKFCFFQE